MIIKYLVRELATDKFNYARDKQDQIILFDTFKEAWEQTDNGLKAFVERIDLEDKYVLIDNIAEEDKHSIDKSYRVYNLYEILNCINADRSENWSDYDQSDFETGLEEFTEFTLIGKLQPLNLTKN